MSSVSQIVRATRGTRVAQGFCAGLLSLTAWLGSALGNEYSVSLMPSTAGSSYSSLGLKTATRAEPFKKEPADSAKGWLRGTLRVDLPDAPEVSYLWDRKKTLILDSNGNGDLTDDAQGTFKAEHNFSNSGYNYASFPRVRLPVSPDAAVPPIEAELTFNESSHQLHIFGRNRSYNSGKLDLDGKSWEIGVLSGPNGASGLAAEYLLLRPWADRSNSFSLAGSDTATFRNRKRVFFQGKSFKIDVVPNKTVATAVKLTEEPIELGELQIHGTNIGVLILQSTDYVVVVDNPGKTVLIPFGRYTSHSVQVGKGEDRALRTLESSTNTTLVVAAGKSPTLITGGPLANSVDVKTRGRYLQLDYKLRGADGSSYTLKKSREAPHFAIYEGTRRVATGKFEYG